MDVSDETSPRHQQLLLLHYLIHLMDCGDDLQGSVELAKDVSIDNTSVSFIVRSTPYT